MLLTVAPAAKGLFQKAIPESGPSRFVHDMKHAAKLTEDFMNLSGTRKMSDLMKKSAAELRAIYVKLFEMRIKLLTPTSCRLATENFCRLTRLQR